jgi:hypothetical protein
VNRNIAIALALSSYQRLGPGVLGNARLRDGADHQSADQWEERQSGDERRKAELLLEEEGEKQKYFEGAGAGQRDRGVGAGPVLDGVQRQQRMVARRSISTKAVSS